MIYFNLFKKNYPSLKGRDWIRTVSPEDRQAFTRIGFTHSGYGRLGGTHRGKFGKRDKRGRFTK